MFNFLKKKKEEKKDYTFWIQEEIKDANEAGIKLEDYVTINTHPLHAKQIKLAIADELSPNQLKVIVNTKYTNEEELIDLRKEFLITPDFNYIKEYYKPKIIKENDSEITFSALYGTILGDIIGSIYEYVDHKEVNTLLRNSSNFTDDTTMSIATMLAIQEDDINPDFRKWYLKLYHEYPRAGYGASFSRWAIGVDIDNTIGYGSYADGSAMRVSFIGAYYKSIDDVIKYAYQSAMVSHNHLDAVKGAIITAVCIWMCKNDYTREEIKEYIYEHYSYNDKFLELKSTGYTNFNLKDPRNNNFRKKGNISCSFAVPYAVLCFLESTSYDDCMKKVLSNFCDADTICAIAGGMAAVFYHENHKEIVENKLPEKLKNYINDFINSIEENKEK